MPLVYISVGKNNPTTFCLLLLSLVVLLLDNSVGQALKWDHFEFGHHTDRHKVTVLNPATVFF